LNRRENKCSCSYQIIIIANAVLSQEKMMSLQHALVALIVQAQVSTSIHNSFCFFLISPFALYMTSKLLPKVGKQTKSPEAVFL
jgi:hypothetical protein